MIPRGLHLQATDFSRYFSRAKATEIHERWHDCPHCGCSLDRDTRVLREHCDTRKAPQSSDKHNE